MDEVYTNEELQKMSQKHVASQLEELQTYIEENLNFANYYDRPITVEAFDKVNHWLKNIIQYLN